MPNPWRTAVLAILSLAVPSGVARAQEAGFGDATRLARAAPLAVRSWVDWDELITETAGGATEDQFLQAVGQTFEATLAEEGVALDPASERFLMCRVETLYDRGLIAFAARVELHEPFGDNGQTAITWHRTWLGTTPVQGMHLLFTIGERCAEDFVEARDGAGA